AGANPPSNFHPPPGAGRAPVSTRLEFPGVPMRLVTFRAHPAAAARSGASAEGYVIDSASSGQAGGVASPDDMSAFIDLGPVAVAQASKSMESYRGAWPVGAASPQENVKSSAPIPRPRKNIFGIGSNYVEHVAESSRTLD
ncbi:hypothetical protein OY671_012376, partial [Metschnikowia pulcherrima]